PVRRRDGIIDVPQLPALATAGPPPSHDHLPAPSGRKMSDAELARHAGSFPGTRRELARQLGLSERTLYRRLKAWGMPCLIRKQLMTGNGHAAPSLMLAPASPCSDGSASGTRRIKHRQPRSRHDAYMKSSHLPNDAAQG
ncbi:MAG TPA: helix-turn-helix domain-containing protein, partial [Noviherbaspirillum sp.]